MLFEEVLIKVVFCAGLVWLSVPHALATLCFSEQLLKTE